MQGLHNPLTMCVMFIRCFILGAKEKRIPSDESWRGFSSNGDSSTFDSDLLSVLRDWPLW